MIRMEALLWILLPGFVAVASGVLSWFVMQSRMEVALAQQRERLAESRGALEAERNAVRDSVAIAVHAAEERSQRQALDAFLGELKVEQRHYTRENRLLLHNRQTWCCRSGCLPEPAALGLDRARNSARRRHGRRTAGAGYDGVR